MAYTTPMSESRICLRCFRPLSKLSPWNAHSVWSVAPVGFGNIPEMAKSMPGLKKRGKKCPWLPLDGIYTLSDNFQQLNCDHKRRRSAVAVWWPWHLLSQSPMVWVQEVQWSCHLPAQPTTFKVFSVQKSSPDCEMEWDVCTLTCADMCSFTSWYAAFWHWRLQSHQRLAEYSMITTCHNACTSKNDHQGKFLLQRSGLAALIWIILNLHVLLGWAWMFTPAWTLDHWNHLSSSIHDWTLIMKFWSWIWAWWLLNDFGQS